MPTVIFTGMKFCRCILFDFKETAHQAGPGDASLRIARGEVSGGRIDRSAGSEEKVLYFNGSVTRLIARPIPIQPAPIGWMPDPYALPQPFTAMSRFRRTWSR